MPINPQLAAYKLCKAADWMPSQLSVQKGLYLAHMHFLGQNSGQPLVDERFEAWHYGPVLPSLYHKLKIFGARPVKDIFQRVDRDYESPEVALVEEVGRQIKDIPASALVSMTHHPKGAWAKNYEPGPSGEIIPNDDIRQEYQDIWAKGYAR